MARKKLKADEFRQMAVGKVITDAQAGPHSEGGECLILRLKSPETGAEERLVISVGTVYGDLWVQRKR